MFAIELYGPSIYVQEQEAQTGPAFGRGVEVSQRLNSPGYGALVARSEEHTSELQSP